VRPRRELASCSFHVLLISSSQVNRRRRIGSCETPLSDFLFVLDTHNI
jgi:hypothetical protein